MSARENTNGHVEEQILGKREVKLAKSGVYTHRPWLVYGGRKKAGLES
jgi:hypothetical protein